jgi:hypothetical protein
MGVELWRLISNGFRRQNGGYAYKAKDTATKIENVFSLAWGL